MVAIDNLKKKNVFLTQIVLAGVIYAVSEGFRLKRHIDWDVVVTIVRVLVHLMAIEGLSGVIPLVYNALWTKNSLNLTKMLSKYKKSISLFIACVAFLVYNEEWGLGRLFLTVAVAKHIVMYLQMDEKPAPITYGRGMACSFFEGYLVHILPPDENQYEGFLGSIRTFQDSNNVVFPVRKLFLVITASLYCPPTLEYFNKENAPDATKLLACKNLNDVTKNVAGVRDRIYRNSVYKVQRAGLMTYVAVECATPLHTLYKVMRRRELPEELLHADVEEIRNDFCSMLELILAKSPDCHDKCVLVYYDDRDETQNLGDIILQKISEIQESSRV